MRGITPDIRKDIYMVSDRRRILELALESLENKKMELDAEIAEIVRELRGGVGRQTSAANPKPAAASVTKHSRFTKEERVRRSQRMKAYWDNWRKKNSRRK
jgi:hypothetical protein